MKHFPSKLPKNRVPDREYFFNILHTFHSGYVQQLIRHAHNERHSAEIEARAIETIEMSDNWWKQLNEVPFVSCKYFQLILITKLFFTLARTQREDDPFVEVQLQASSLTAQAPQD